MRCPQCHRPVDDADAAGHLCAADASLRWRCTQCAELSQGFAFAYGLCPRCGGQLAALDSPHSERDAALQGIRTAFEI